MKSVNYNEYSMPYKMKLLHLLVVSITYFDLQN
jgi:hypothetical protein